MRQVISALDQSLPAVLNVMMVLLLFLMLFVILGMQYYGGRF